MGSLLFVVNSPDFFVSHRIEIAKAALKQGYEVHVASAAGDGVEVICNAGCIHHPIGFTRSGQSPLAEIKTLVQIGYLFRKLKPDLLHLVTIKPVLYGGIIARLTRVPAVVAAVSGLGTVFLAESRLAKIRRAVVKLLYRLAFSHKNLLVIFQNPDDRDAILKTGALTYGEVRMIPGSGVDLTAYTVKPEPILENSVVVMASRLLKDKGVFEFVEAARILKLSNVPVRMRLLGEPDLGNPTSVSPDQIKHWRQEGIVDLPGFNRDVAKEYEQSNIVCLPSYREGLPKALVEAAACGRAVVTTDVPGCRDAIVPNITGLLVPVKNSKSLAIAIEKLIANPQLRFQMGKAGRELAEKSFSIDVVVDQHLSIYKELLSNI